MDAKAYYESIRHERDQWRWKLMAERDGRCMLCNAKRDALDCHEMLPRGRFPRSWGSTANYLLLCRIKCHDAAAAMPLTHQLSLKLFCDPDSFDIAEISRIAGREIRLRDVVAAAKLLL